MNLNSSPSIATVCYHCGEDCENTNIHIAEKIFCCEGCKTVYGILNKVDLCDYYTINKTPGLNQRSQIRKDKFAFLDDEQLQMKLIHFKDANQSHVTFYLPQMHCSSCIWLLEHLTKLDHHIVRSQVNFLKKELSLVFENKETSLRSVVELLTSIGYEPHLSLNDLADKGTKKYDKSRLYKIGITGFCFGNIMLLSFPEYFSLGNMEDKGLKTLFSYLILGLSLPVFFYGASEFFISAWKSFKQKFFNIDSPIAIGILITFGRSVFEITTNSGAGYLDSMTGIVFFMLIGRFFQNKTYNTLTFNRDYTSYFPLGVTIVQENGQEEQVPISNLKIGQRIKIHNGEIIPADAILFFGKAIIDYSFVSGESLPVEKGIGEIIYAGGKQTKGAIELEVVKEVSQSYLTELWNNEAFKKGEEKGTSYIHVVSKYFTLFLFSIAATAATYWYVHDPSRVWNSITSVLIVACPCALLLSATFTNGNMLRILQKFGFYVRHASVIEQIGKVDTIVFDKTGTITQQQQSAIEYKGSEMTDELRAIVRSLTRQSNHPLSKAIYASLLAGKTFQVKEFEEFKGMGMRGIINSMVVEMGSAVFVNKDNVFPVEGSSVFIKVNGKLIGRYVIKTNYRKGYADILSRLKEHYKLSLLSGDNDAERSKLSGLFNLDLLFNKLPNEKLNYVRSLQQDHKKVMMVGDGLNDAGALKQSDVGVVITDDINNFSPACDVIMNGECFSNFDAILNYCKKNKLIINLSFVISILYNMVGLYFAVQGRLEPVIAAILMPISSITIVLLTTGMSSLLALKLKTSTSKKEKTDLYHLNN